MGKNDGTILAVLVAAGVAAYALSRKPADDKAGSSGPLVVSAGGGDSSALSALLAGMSLSNLGGGGGSPANFTLPEIKMPEIKIPEFKTPDLLGNAPALNLDAFFNRLADLGQFNNLAGDMLSNQAKEKVNQLKDVIPNLNVKADEDSGIPFLPNADVPALKQKASVDLGITSGLGIFTLLGTKIAAPLSVLISAGARAFGIKGLAAIGLRGLPFIGAAIAGAEVGATVYEGISGDPVPIIGWGEILGLTKQPVNETLAAREALSGAPEQSVYVKTDVGHPGENKLSMGAAGDAPPWWAQ